MPLLEEAVEGDENHLHGQVMRLHHSTEISALTWSKVDSVLALCGLTKPSLVLVAC